MTEINATLKTIHSHRSIRSYKPDPIPQAVLDRVLGAALRASSSGNMQSFSIIVTSDPAVREELFSAHFEQAMVREAPLLLTFCSDFNRMRKWLALRDAPPNFDNFMSFMIGAFDATLASQNAAIAAESEGLGICYMGTTLASCSEIAKILRCPPQVVPVVGFSLGYSAEDPKPRDRLPLQGMVHQDRYQDYSDQQIEAIYKDRDEAGWKRYMSSPDLRARVEASNVANLAQLYTRLKYTRESHLEFSETVLTCLKEQGFMNHEA